MTHLLSSFIAFLKLSKPIITLSVAFSALTGYILHNGSFSDGWLFMYLGVLLIAGGSSSLNQLQESGHDSLMKRTRHRPLPSGELTKPQALIWSILLSVAGATLLWYHSGSIPALLAILTLLWYNGIYTPMKRVSPWAILPGALVGALPPAIGWTAAGGTLGHPHILFVAFFFFIGQIPHFWLILLRHGKDYEQAGFPSITTRFLPAQIARLTFTWTACTATTALALPAFGVINTPLFSALTLLFSLALLLSFLGWPDIKKPERVNRAFMAVNIYFLLMMLVLMGDALWSNP